MVLNQCVREWVLSLPKKILPALAAVLIKRTTTSKLHTATGSRRSRVARGSREQQFS